LRSGFGSKFDGAVISPMDTLPAVAVAVALGVAVAVALGVAVAVVVGVAVVVAVAESAGDTAGVAESAVAVAVGFGDDAHAATVRSTKKDARIFISP
jgi:hypothetical protein